MSTNLYIATKEGLEHYYPSTNLRANMFYVQASKHPVGGWAYFDIYTKKDYKYVGNNCFLLKHLTLATSSDRDTLRESIYEG